MSCLMVNESVGEAFIDAAIPSVFSSMLIFGAALYQISLLALLLPLCVAAGFVLYRTFIYRPAKKAHERRRCLLKDRRENTDFSDVKKRLRKVAPSDSASLRRRAHYSCCEFIRRFLMNLKYGTVAAITHVSVEKLRKRFAVKAVYSQLWCDMNKPASHQGTLLSYRGGGCVSAFNMRIEYSKTTDRCSLKQRGKTLSTPQRIMRMMSSSRIIRAVPDDHPCTDNFPRGREHRAIVSVADDLIVIKPLRKRTLHRELRSLLFFDTGEALLRIWSNLNIANEQANGIDHGIDIDVHEVPVPTLLKELHDIFDSFYPDGIPMSESSRNEASELCIEWIRVQNTSRNNREASLDRQMVRFKSFHNWFYDLLEMIHNTVSDRLIDYFMLSSTRSVTTSAASRKFFKAVAPQYPLDSPSQLHFSSPNLSLYHSPSITFHENPIFGSPRHNVYTRNGSDQSSYQGAQRPIDSDDLYSTYAWRPSRGTLSDSIYPLNNLGGTPRKFTYPQSCYHLVEEDDIDSTEVNGFPTIVLDDLTIK